jgi:hypothetical protein
MAVSQAEKIRRQNDPKFRQQRIKDKNSFNLDRDIAAEAAFQKAKSGKAAAAAKLKKTKALKLVNQSSAQRTSTVKTVDRRKLSNVKRAGIRKGRKALNGTALDRKTLGV